MAGSVSSQSIPPAISAAKPSLSASIRSLPSQS